MSAQQLHRSLLAPPILHVLRAAGFHSTRPTVLDALVDLVSRYLFMLADSTIQHAQGNHNTEIPDLVDVRMALEECGALRPRIEATVESWRGQEDLRGVDEFIKWCAGEANREIRRVAGLVAEEGEADVEGLAPREDYLSILKKKHSKTGEDSRYQGTVLGRSAEDRTVKIEGGPADTIQAWESMLRERARTAHSTPNDVDMIETGDEDGILDG